MAQLKRRRFATQTRLNLGYFEAEKCVQAKRDLTHNTLECWARARIRAPLGVRYRATTEWLRRVGTSPARGSPGRAEVARGLGCARVTRGFGRAEVTPGLGRARVTHGRLACPAVSSLDLSSQVRRRKGSTPAHAQERPPAPANCRRRATG
jgi:hypothetical protein